MEKTRKGWSIGSPLCWSVPSIIFGTTSSSTITAFVLHESRRWNGISFNSVSRYITNSLQTTETSGTSNTTQHSVSKLSCRFGARLLFWTWESWWHQWNNWIWWSFERIVPSFTPSITSTYKLAIFTQSCVSTTFSWSKC